MATEPNADNHGEIEPDGPNRPQPGRLRPVSRWILIALAALGVAIGWTVVIVIENGGGVAPTVSWLTPVAWGFLAALLFLAARNTHQRIQVRRERIEPQRAVFFLLLAKASAFVGALSAGVYTGFALSFVDSFEASGPRNRTIICGLAALLAVAVVIAGLLLERACRVPPTDPNAPA